MELKVVSFIIYNYLHKKTTLNERVVFDILIKINCKNLGF